MIWHCQTHKWFITPTNVSVGELQRKICDVCGETKYITKR